MPRPPAGAPDPPEGSGAAGRDAVPRVAWPWAAAGAAGFLALCWLVRGFVTDDAWITARYAENLASGHGFVWNPGGERVEGFSNPLLMAVEALGHVAGIPAIATARAVGVASGLGLVVVLWRLGPRAVGAPAARLGLLFTALYPPMAFWAIGGLETLPAALAATAGVLWLVIGGSRGARLGGAALAVLPWLRPEGLGVALAVALLAEGPGVLRGDERRAAARRLVVAAGLPLASQALLEVARLVIYGHLLPNSALFKSGRGTITDVLERFVEQAPTLLALAACGLLVARGRRWLLVVPALVYAAGSVGMLDSVNGFSRMFLPVVPALGLLAAVAITTAHRRLRRTGTAAAVVAAVLLFAPSVMLAFAVDRSGERYMACSHDARDEAAAWLRANTAPGTVYSVSDAGLLPLRAGDRVAVDQLRLNDPQIQRSGVLPLPQEIDLVYDAGPEIVILASTTPDRLAGRYIADRTMTADRRFRGYRLAHVASGDAAGCGYHLFLYRRR